MGMPYKLESSTIMFHCAVKDTPYGHIDEHDTTSHSYWHLRFLNCFSNLKGQTLPSIPHR